MRVAQHNHLHQAQSKELLLSYLEERKSRRVVQSAEHGPFITKISSLKFPTVCLLGRPRRSKPA
ncbi:hypothetical protein RND71_034993 [Anisodus tanguticus]|uniref:Uncharacterized protein n=1 Tax=Anisodus tanguticus TaxID=243964 RepID=A0AAE1R6B6_9SOLA|nr:hypothetical protein RND71_034993 [Anisodus tanguticus]